MKLLNGYDESGFETLRNVKTQKNNHPGGTFFKTKVRTARQRRPFVIAMVRRRLVSHTVAMQVGCYILLAQMIIWLATNEGSFQSESYFKYFMARSGDYVQ